MLGLRACPSKLWRKRKKEFARNGGSPGFLGKLGTVKCLDKTLQALNLLHQQGVPVSRDDLYFLLQCGFKKKHLRACRQVHSFVVGSEIVTILGDHLIRLFALCGSLLEANLVFCKVSKPSIYTWSAIISAHSTFGESARAIEIYYRMQQEGIEPSKYILSCILKACSGIGDTWQGRLVHNHIIKSDVESDVILGNALIDMYSKSGSLLEAQKVFDDMLIRDLVSWGAMIAGYVQNGQHVLALDLFNNMQKDGILPDTVMLLSTLKICASIGDMGQGKLIHEQIVKSGMNSDLVLGSTLADMYGKCGSLEDACNIFTKLSGSDVVLWGVMIAGYAQHGHNIRALELFEGMQQRGLKADKSTLLCTLKACGNMQAIEEGKLMHAQVIQSGLQSDVEIGTALIDMYAKCGNLGEACQVFDKLPHHDVVSWGAIITGFVQHGHEFAALELSERMQQECIEPNKVILKCVLKACGSIGAVEQGKLIHEQIVKSGLALDAFIVSALVDMYAKCGSLNEGRKVFNTFSIQDVVLWNIMIAGYSQHGHAHSAIELFEKLQDEGIRPDQVTFSCILKACSSMATIPQGELIHDQIIRSGLESNMIIGNTLVDMYSSCGNLEEAARVFDNMPIRDVVSWNSMMGGCGLHVQCHCVIDYFERMLQEGIVPDKVTFSCALDACGGIGSIVYGRLMHGYVVETGLELDVVIGSKLVDMYARCGSLDEARGVFDKLTNRDVVLWDAIIAAYAQHGNYSLALQCLDEMQQKGLKPDSATFTSILAACTHTGQVEEGHRYFKAMKEEYCITTSIEHLSCVVDLLGRAGRLDEAKELLQTMPILPDATVWTCLLTACRTYGDVELGRFCFDEVVRLDPNTAAGYVLMSNIYADAQMWEDFCRIQELRKCASAWKKPGRAWIMIDDQIHDFVVGDIAHPYIGDTCVMSKRLSRLIKGEGYMPQLSTIEE